MSPMRKEVEAPKLSPRETEIITRIAHGMTHSEIALDLNIKAGTIRSYAWSIRKKVNGTINRAVYIYTKAGIIE